MIEVKEFLIGSLLWFLNILFKGKDYFFIFICVGLIGLIFKVISSFFCINFCVERLVYS